MCGIFGYVGGAPASVDQVVLGALRAMEYRGYDSWGTAYVTPGHEPGVAKGVGRVPRNGTVQRDASAAIGHTRWATHGEVCERNAHPHFSADRRIAIVHNGIIENTAELQLRLGDVGYASDTDTELMAHLVRREMMDGNGLQRAVQNAFCLIEGTNAFVALDLATKEIVTITHRLPIRISRVDNTVMLASDPAVFAGHAESTLVLPDDTAVSLGVPGIMAESLLELERTGEHIAVPEVVHATHVGPGASMHAEIAEQPTVLRRLAADQDAVDTAIHHIASSQRVMLTGCGSAFHAAQYAADQLAYSDKHLNALAIPASELAARAGSLTAGDVVIALTQSGETADVIDAVMAAAERRATTIGVVNVPGSTVARMVDVQIPLLAGTERSVLATKSLTAMLGRMVQLVEGFAHKSNGASEGNPANNLMVQANELESILASPEATAWVEALHTSLMDRSSALVVGAGSHMAIASEAALKIKEGTYVHAEAVRAGELKHGVIALIDEGFPCLLMSGDATEARRQRIVAAELRSRGATVFELLTEGADGPAGGSDNHTLVAPSPFAQTIVAQLVALKTALARGVDPDFPRNLAKSVTVR